MDLFNIVTLSDKRKNLLTFLYDGPKSWEEIRQVFQFPSAAIIPQIRILEGRNLVVRENGIYQLTTIGRVITEHLKYLVATIEVFEAQWKFWQEHNIDTIPDEFLMRIGDLGHVELNSVPIERIYQMKEMFLSNISRAKVIYGLVHTMHPLYLSVFQDIAKGGSKISLIFTRPVFEIIQEDYLDVLREWLDFKGIHLSVLDDDTQFSFIATDKYMSLQLPFSNNTFDSINEICSKDEKALSWCKDLFEFYRAKSFPVA
ncbi:MAG: winged helix-turn-helix domain-containing protein [Methanolinea sp.]|nr:winged helix-turn-helix domain-containing protein [Methanolinea sp.]